MPTYQLQLLALFLLTSTLLNAQPPQDDEYARKLEAISIAYAQMSSTPDIGTLVKLDQELRELVRAISKIETAKGTSYFRREYEPLGLERNHWGGNLEYNGALLKQAHRLNPDSPFRGSTLFSAIEIGYSRSGLPGIENAHRYVTEFPDGPFIGDVYEILATFYDDLYKSARGELTKSTDDNHEDYRECYAPYFSQLPFEIQMVQAQALSVLFYDKAIAAFAGNAQKTEQLTSHRNAVRDGTTQGWFWCSAC